MRMLVLLLILGLPMLALAGVVLTRNLNSARLQLGKYKSALAQSSTTLFRIQAYSQDDYAKDLAEVTLSEVATLLGKKPRELI